MLTKIAFILENKGSVKESKKDTYDLFVLTENIFIKKFIFIVIK